MPRKRKPTLSGDPAQKIESVPGQRYGEGPDQAALMETLPAPDTAGVPVPTQGGGPPLPGPMPIDPNAVQEFLGGHNPNLLAGTARPDVPLTDGMSNGPGRGPEALTMNSTPVARFFTQLAKETGNAKWAHLAERAGLR